MSDWRDYVAQAAKLELATCPKCKVQRLVPCRTPGGVLSRPHVGRWMATLRVACLARRMPFAVSAAQRSISITMPAGQVLNATGTEYVDAFWGGDEDNRARHDAARMIVEILAAGVYEKNLRTAVKK